MTIRSLRQHINNLVPAQPMHNHSSHHLGLVLVHIMRCAESLPKADMRVLGFQAVSVRGRVDAPHGWVACEDDELGRG